MIRPLTPVTWSDFEQLFGPKGAYGGCWCMWWRLSRKEFEQSQGEKNRQAMKAIVDSGIIPGLIGYNNHQPCGWISVAPRQQFAALERSRVLKRIDDADVWSIVCFFIHKSCRSQGVGEKLIRGAIEYVREHGGEIIEAYPTVIRSDHAPPVSSFMGIPKIFLKLGFLEVKRPSPSKMILRYYV